MNDREVYVIECSKNGRRYVGSTSKGMDERVEKHLCLLNAHKHPVGAFQNDFDLYGKETFIARLIGRFDSNTAYRIEYLLMNLYGTKDIERGYNYKDKSGDSDINDINQIIKELKKISYLTDTTIESLLKNDNEIFFHTNISVDIQRIKDLSNKNGLTINELENKLGISHGTIRRWKNTMARADNLLIVAEYFGVSMESLLTKTYTYPTERR